jgi:hypothetical protein
VRGGKLGQEVDRPTLTGSERRSKSFSPSTIQSRKHRKKGLGSSCCLTSRLGSIRCYYGAERDCWLGPQSRVRKETYLRVDESLGLNGARTRAAPRCLVRHSEYFRALQSRLIVLYCSQTESTTRSGRSRVPIQWGARDVPRRTAWALLRLVGAAVTLRAAIRQG